MATRLEYPDRAFRLNFERLCSSLLRHAATYDPACDSFGDKFLSTSIFALPDDVDEWPAEREDVTTADIENVRQSVAAREAFVANALAAGFDPSAIYRPALRGWMLQRLRERRFQEKQVDATVVALLVRSAITNAGDYHAILTGDSDILPAIKVAYPQYSENVFVATTHPDQLRGEARQTSFALADFDYRLRPFFLDEHAADIVDGQHVYQCAHCNKVFVRPAAIPVSARPCCNPCHKQRI